MRRKTFDILARYVAQANDINVCFDSEKVPYADLKNRVIHMPKEIGKNKAFAALALLIHEAAHLKHSIKIPINTICSDEIDKAILNVMEDTRIDRINFNILPNVKGFYEVLIKDYIKPLPKEAPLCGKVLITLMLEAEGFHGYKDKEVIDIIDNTAIRTYFWRGINHIEWDNWDELKNDIKKIREILEIEANKNTEKKEQNQDKQEENQEQNGNQEGKGQDGKGEDKEEKSNIEESKIEKGANLGENIEEILRPKNVWKDDGEMLEAENSTVNLEEVTIDNFKRLLNMKEKRTIQDSVILDTDNLTSYFTGDIDELFKDENIVKNKKSKVLLLLDASGSMLEPLISGERKFEVVAKCCEKITKILDEVIEAEGLNVSYKIAAFNEHYIPFDTKEWRKYYIPRGGTYFDWAFRDAIDDFLKDNSIEGKRIIIVFSDGDIGNDQIDSIKKNIIKSGNDIRCLIIGVGTDPNSKFAKEIIGERIIFVDDNANEVLLETIKEML